MNGQNDRSAYNPGRYAAIDIGTVTCRMLVADVDEHGVVTPVHIDGEVCNLGLGVDKTGRLSQEGIDHAARTIERFAIALEAMRARGSSIEVRTCATSASRDASNASDFLERVAEFGIVPEVIPGEEEAALSFAGATSAFPGETVVVSDVGGGSTEVIAGSAGRAPAHAESFNVGCRRVTERFFLQDPPRSDEISAAVSWVSPQISPYMSKLREEGFLDGRFVAVGGTATSIIAMRERMSTYDGNKVNGAVLTSAELDGLIDQVAPMTLSQRERIPGLDPARAPVILAGILITRQLLDSAGIDSITVSDRGIRHGVVLDLARV